MLKLDISEIALAVKSQSKFEKISIVLKASTELEDFLLTLAESFDFSTESIAFLENVVKGDPVDLDSDFMKQIYKIKEAKDGFQALMFCLKHFGFEKAEEALSQIFDMKAEPYKPILEKLLEFRLGRKLKAKKIKKEQEKSIVQHGELLSQRIYAPIETNRIDVPEALGLYRPLGSKEKQFVKAIGQGNSEIYLGKPPIVLDMWPGVPKGIFSATIRSIRKEHSDVVVLKEGVLRVVNIYSH